MTDGQTDGQTDGRTDKVITIGIRRLRLAGPKSSNVLGHVSLHCSCVNVV